MKPNNKTFNNKKCNNKKHFIYNKKFSFTQNKSMTKKQTSKPNCNVVVMPPPITDNDITALFNGLLGVVKKKFELENKAQILNSNITLEKALKELKAKQAECNRLKNQIISLKTELEKYNSI